MVAIQFLEWAGWSHWGWSGEKSARLGVAVPGLEASIDWYNPLVSIHGVTRDSPAFDVHLPFLS